MYLRRLVGLELAEHLHADDGIDEEQQQDEKCDVGERLRVTKIFLVSLEYRKVPETTWRMSTAAFECLRLSTKVSPSAVHGRVGRS